MAYHNGDGWVSMHHPDDSFHSNELCRHCFANMVCTGLGNLKKGVLSLGLGWGWAGIPSRSTHDELRVVGQTLLPAQTVPMEIHHPHGLGSALTPFGSGYNKDVSGRGCVSEQLLWRASCAQALGLIGTSTSEGVSGG